MHARVDDPADGSPDFILQASVVAVRVLVETDFLPQSFGVKGPAFRVGIEVESKAAERREIGEFLRNGKLQVMPRNTFVIGDSFDVQQKALLRRIFVDVDTPGARAGAGTDGVIGWDASGRAKFLHGDDIELVLRESADKFWKLAVHLVSIFRVKLKQLLARLGVKRGILTDVCVKRFQIVEALRLCDLKHLLFDLRHALQSHFVNLVSGEVGCALVMDGEAVTRVPIGKRPNTGIEAAMRSVVSRTNLANFA